MKTHLILSIICFWFTSIWANSSDRYYFRHYSNKDGLSNNTVYCTLQDQKGIMWFGTSDGLNRFDGYSFQHFRNETETAKINDLLNSRIIHLFEDSSGKIWIATDHGVCYYDYLTNSFEQLTFDNSHIPFYADHIYEDKEGYLWFRRHHSICRYDQVNKSHKTFTHEECNFRSVTMTMTSEGTPIFADAAALFEYNFDTKTFVQITDIYSFRKSNLNVISAIKEVPQLGFFIGTEREGLLLYHSNNRKVEILIPNIHVRSIMQYSPNVYWIASESGIYIYNLIDKTITNLRKSLVNNYAIADNAIYSLTKDKEGGVWVTSYFGGINYLSQNYSNFTYYIGGKTHPGMLGNTVREICADKYGFIWMSTEDNGVNRYNPQTDQMENYSPLNSKSKLSATNIHGIYCEGDTLWVGTFNQGIELLHIPTGKTIDRYTQSSTQNGITDFILCFLKTRKGKFLVGTSSGISIYDKSTRTFSRWQGSEEFIKQIVEDKEGSIWAATSAGLFRYSFNPLTDEVKSKHYVGNELSGSEGLSSSNVNAVFEDSKGTIWIATSNGISLYNKRTDSFSKITKENGLPSNMIYRIVEDKNNLFWISTANGLVRFNPDTYTINTYSFSDGLPEIQFNYSSSYIDSIGTIYMGTINGMISFDPKKFKRNNYSPPLYITRIQAHDDPDKNRILLSEISKNNELRLPYDASTFSISYIAPSYTSPDAIKYAYQLEGADKEWIPMDNNKSVTFASLSPGEYLFKVHSTDSEGVWQANECTLRIIITPPFWGTVWAFAIYILIIIGGVVFFYKYKKRKLIIRTQQKLERFEIEKEKEVYDAKIQFFTFITHEIRTPLTLITAPLEKIINSGEGSSVTKKNLKTIERNTQRLLDLSNQLLDFRKTESKGFRLNFIKTNITLLLENIIVQFTAAFENEKKNFIVEKEEKHLFATIDRDGFTKIVTNLLSNALKYSADSVNLRLISPNESESVFQIVVTSNGYLIPQEESEKIFSPFYRLHENENIQGSGIGLSLSRTLAQFHNGTLCYQESKNGLNQFILTLPIVQTGICSEENEEIIETTNDSVGKENTNRHVVLIVEDQADMRSFLSSEMRPFYKILEAPNGKIALNLLDRNKIDLILSDIMMPLMDGFELCNAVKNDIQYSHIPMILLTAQHNFQSRLTGLNQGADAYMEKPFSVDHLLAQVANLIKNRELLRQSYIEKPQTPSSELAVSLVDNAFLQQLNEYIEENLTNEALSVDMLAARMNMSNSSLYRKVKGLSNLSPVDFIRIARLKKAVQLMQQNENRINEIAFLAGFSSPAYFSTCFQKQYGKSPSEFMKELDLASK